MNESVNKYLSSVGLKFPENSIELLAFEQFNQFDQCVIDVDRVDPFKILKQSKPLQLKAKVPTNVDFHKRTVLAAEIVHQLKGDNFLGHLKLQKLLFLCQNTSKMELHTNFLKQAMGPYDPLMMRSIDAQFKKNQWFVFQKDEFPKYQPLAKCGGHIEWYNRYFKDNSDDISSLIDTFRSFKTNDIELVATLFACWQEALMSKSIISDALLIQKVYDWHESKSKFPQEAIVNAISWMKEKRIVPVISCD
jgi:hypothetical protein